MKIIKWIGVIFLALVVIGMLVLALESDEDKAARELKNEQDKIAAAQADTDKQAVKEKAEAKKKVVKTRSGIPNRGGKSEPELITDCQIDIQNKLSNPRSIDIINSDLKYKKEPNHTLWFQFYAKNQFNAESRHTAMCEFDDDGNLLSSKFE